MPGDRSKKQKTASPGDAPITPELERFLAAFAKDDDRIAAAKAAGLSWREVKDALAKSAAFRDRYEEIMEEREVALVDQWGKAGREGNAAAAKHYLSAVGSRLARAAGDEDDAPGNVPATDARDFARQIFGPAESEVN